MHKVKRCDMCGKVLSDYKNVVCFYPWDETKNNVSHANPYVNMCNGCFNELRNVVALQMEITNLEVDDD